MNTQQHGTPAVSVIVPARDAAPTLGRTLEALRAQNLRANFEVIVVDDGSQDATAEIAARYEPFVTLMRSETSRGPGAARNCAATAAHAPVLAFTDADCFPTIGWLAAGLSAIAGCDLVQGAVRPDPMVVRSPFDRTVEVGSERGFYETANLLVRRDIFNGVGGFRDWVLDQAATRRWSPDHRRGRVARTPIGEDTLFAWRARRRGARTCFAPDALVHHAVIPGRLRDDLADRWHWSRDMPGLARQVPELRDRCFHRRLFFHRKTARFDLALASVATAALTRRSLLLAGVFPYADWVLREAAAWGGGRTAKSALGSLAADATTFAGLLTGSAAWRCLLL